MTRNERPETFFIVAGEASGDMHGGKLIDEIKKRHPNSRFIGHGGDRMVESCLLYTSPSPRDLSTSRMPSSA